MKPRVTVVTAGHLSTCPRMLKAADALYGAGYRVRVVSTRHTPWASDTDCVVRASRSWEWTVVDYQRSSARVRQVITGVRFHLARAAARSLGPDRVPAAVAPRAYSRAHDELVRAIAAVPADFVYGGTTGALAAVAQAAARLSVPYALDLEDFHSGELAGPDGELDNALAATVERLVLAGASFLTAGSPMIADAYRQKYGLRPRAIHNTFPMQFSPDGAREGGGPLRLYWFSQTLGPGRGLEDVIEGAGRADIDVELHLRARPLPQYLDVLRRLRLRVARRLTIEHHEPGAPDEMVVLAQPYDFGLSCDEPTVLNRRLCLCNKIFTYLAAGVPVLLSRTPAQTELARDLGQAACSYVVGDVDEIATILRRLAKDEGVRLLARCAARAAAIRRWHWEHPEDRGALLERVVAVVPL